MKSKCTYEDSFFTKPLPFHLSFSVLFAQAKEDVCVCVGGDLKSQVYQERVLDCVCVCLKGGVVPNGEERVEGKTEEMGPSWVWCCYCVTMATARARADTAFRVLHVERKM